MVFVSTSFAGATFHPGDRGSQVLAVQQQLAADGYSLTVDGDYGTGTTEAIRAFQQDHGLTLTESSARLPMNPDGRFYAR